MAKTATLPLPSPADRLGAVRAQIADLEKVEAELKAEIIALGVSSLSGALFDATVVEQERAVTAWKDIAIKAGASRQLISANTKKIEVVSVKTTARKTSKSGKAAA